MAAMNQASPEALDIGKGDEKDCPFSSVTTGVQSNGCVTADIGWASCGLFESLGIEAIVGIDGFASAIHFKEWFESVIGIELNDWEPVEVMLFECWMPCLHDQFPEWYGQKLEAEDENPYEEQFCYKVWRQAADADAIKAEVKRIYALRHVAYSLKSERGVDYLHAARNKSYASRCKAYGAKQQAKAIT